MSLNGDVRKQTAQATVLWNRFLRYDPVREDLILSKYSSNEFVKPVMPFIHGDSAFALTCTRLKPFLHDDSRGKGWIIKMTDGAWLRLWINLIQFISLHHL